MSIKIHAGVTLNFGDSPWERVEEIRGACERTFEELNKEFTTDKVFYVYSSFVQKNIDNDSTPLEHGIMIQALKEFQERDSQDDLLYCKVLVFPPNKSRLHLGFISGKNEYYENILNELDYVSEYNYWDNTDMHEVITDKEWKQRSQEWKEILDKGFFLGTTGISIEVPQTKLRTFDLLQLKGGLKIGEKELRRMSCDLVFKRVLLKRKIITDTMDASKWTSDGIMSSFMLSQDLISGKELDELPFTSPLAVSTEQLLSTNLEDVPMPEFNKENLDAILTKLDI